MYEFDCFSASALTHTKSRGWKKAWWVGPWGAACLHPPCHYHHAWPRLHRVAFSTNFELENKSIDSSTFAFNVVANEFAFNVVAKKPGIQILAMEQFINVA